MNPRIPYRLAPGKPLARGNLPGSLIVHLVVNVEYWPFEKPMPRKLMGGPHGDDAVPDVLNYGWFEYGMRCGLRRLLDLGREFGIPMSASTNSAVIGAYPEAAEAILAAGWEFIAHGVTQTSLAKEDDERATILRALDEFEAFSGARPRGWLSPGLRESLHTPDLLEQAGVEYVFDWALDDLPCWMDTSRGSLLAMPYGLELNDSVLFAEQKQTSREYERRIADTLSVYETEIQAEPRILTLPLHPHLMGVPHRYAVLRRAVDTLLKRPDTTFASGAQIADWFIAQVPKPRCKSPSPDE